MIGGIVGGPVAQWLIRKNRLFGATPATEDAGVAGGPVTTPVTLLSFIGSLAAALVAVIVGRELAEITEGAVVTLPSFVWCLFVGLALRNGGPFLGAAAERRGVGTHWLGLPVAIPRLDDDGARPRQCRAFGRTAADHPGYPNRTWSLLWAVLVAFWVVGRDYESAVMAGAFCGFAMGATATAIANMQALTRRYGPAPQAFLVVPLAGAFFIDIMNAAVLTVFLSLGFIGGG